MEDPHRLVKGFIIAWGCGTQLVFLIIAYIMREIGGHEVGPFESVLTVSKGLSSMKFLHTRMRVGNLNRSIDFYCQHLGFRVKRRSDKSPSGNHIAHLELPGNEHMLELTWSADYALKVPEDLMHLAIGVPDLFVCCDRLEKAGLEIWPEGWRVKFASGEKMAFITDPDGYEVELLECGP